MSSRRSSFNGHRVVPASPSAVAYLTAVRLADYLAELDLSFSAFVPLAARLPEAHGALALEHRRVRICLDWARAIVAPSASRYLTESLAHARSIELYAAGRAVRRELQMMAHVAGLIDSHQARTLVIDHIWAAVFAAFTLGHTQPLQAAAAPVLQSAHELLARLVSVSRDLAADDFQPWAGEPVPTTQPPAPLSLYDFIATGRPS